jgi:hypothetical protein
MDHYDVKRLALVCAVNAEIEGMKAENENRKQLNHSMAYDEESFTEKAMELRNLAFIHNDQL